MNLDDRIKNIEEKLGNIPARFATPGTRRQLQVYETAAPPMGAYPLGANANTYYGFKCYPTYPKTVGTQSVTSNVSENGAYIFNLGTGYIEEGTLVLCEYFAGQLYTNVDGPQVYFSSDGSSLTEIQGISAALTGVTISQPYGALAPPLIAVGIGSAAWDITRGATDE